MNWKAQLNYVHKYGLNKCQIESVLNRIIKLLQFLLRYLKQIQIHNNIKLHILFIKIIININ